MSTERVKITYGSDTIIMTWDGAQASAPILVDGIQYQYQTADARHKTGEAVRLAASIAWPDVRDWSAGSEAWDDLEYETLEDDEENEASEDE